MMGIRILCFILMVVITPYGWYTWVFGAAAIFLPYVAVVTANVSQNVRPTNAESPERALPMAPPEAPAAPTAPRTVRIQESRAVDGGEKPSEQA
jgi:hypothetical protein